MGDVHKQRNDSVPHFHETTGTTREGSYSLVRYYRRGGQILRVRVCRDDYMHQSAAIAEVLTPMRTWTDVVDNPPSNWHDKTPRSADKPTQVQPVTGFTTLARLADALARDAMDIVPA